MSIVRQSDSKAVAPDTIDDGADAALVFPREAHGQHDAGGESVPAGPDAARRLVVLLRDREEDVETETGEPEEADAFAEDTADPLAAFVSEAEMIGPGAAARQRRAWSLDRWLAVAFATVAIVEAALLLGGQRLFARFGAAEGTLRIVTEQAGAEVLVDGVRRGAAPLALALAGGAHRIEVRQGDRVRTFQADVRPGGEVAHHVDLAAAVQPGGAPPAAATASIEIASDPPGGRVTIDGAPHGAAPVQVANLPPGPHEVRVTNDAGTVTRQVRLEAGVTASLFITMPRPNAVTSGWVRVRAPISAQIFEGDALIGTTDVDRLMLPAGRHALRLVNRDLGYSSEHTVTITPGQTSVVSVSLPNGLLNVNALPWAQVWIDGQLKGETPIGRLAVPIGVHEIVLRHPDLGERRRSVTVTQGAVTRVGVDLRQP